MVNQVIKKIVKFNTPWGHDFLKNQFSPNLENFQFEIDNDCSICDFWVIWGDLPPAYEKMTVKCDPRHVIYMTDEAYVEKIFNQDFLNQFSAVISLRDDIRHSNLIKSHEINTWHLKKTFAELNNTNSIKKTKMLSVVCSDLTIIPGHKKRYALVNKLIGHFKDRIDVYGSGFNYVEDKWDALSTYRYSIAIENSSIPGYFTEKITECYLAHTYPIYYGAPDITSYFDPLSLSLIDIDDYKKSIDVIEKLLDENPYANREQVLIQQKQVYLNSYQLYSKLSNILTQQFNDGEEKRSIIKIKAHRTYQSNYQLKRWIRYLRQKL